MSQNEKLTYTLREAREHIAALREEVDKLTQPPSAYGTFLGINDDGTVDVLAGGRKMRVAVHPELADDVDALPQGAEVVLNESFNVVLSRSPEGQGEVVTLKEVLEDGRRALIVGRADEERVVELVDVLVGTKLRSGDTMLLDTRSGLLLEKLPRPEVEELVLEEVPDISYEDIGGLDEQIEQIADAVELPFLHQELFAEHQLPAPKGILLYGPPGCGKTLIAKAVANRLAKKVAESTGNEARSYFLNIKGPELLNKYVGETERQIRLVFQRAREKSEEGWPVIVFFDEMDSMFRTRGSGISSDMESTIVPQLLAEIDGVEALKNVIVIGASNREDLIDPAILRPGRLDVKIKIERPNETVGGADLRPVPHRRPPHRRRRDHRLGGGDREKAIPAMIETTVEEMYSTRGPQPVPRGHLPERRQGGHVLQGLHLRRHDREHRPPGQEAGHQAPARRRLQGHQDRGPDRVDQAGVQGARGPAQHHQPRRLGQDLGQEGRAHRLHPHAHPEGRPTSRRGRPRHRAGRHRPVPVRRDRREHIVAIGSWAKKLQTEVEHLPDTLQAMRESSVHIRQVSEDLTLVGRVVASGHRRPRRCWSRRSDRGHPAVGHGDAGHGREHGDGAEVLRRPQRGVRHRPRQAPGCRPPQSVPPAPIACLVEEAMWNGTRAR